MHAIWLSTVKLAFLHPSGSPFWHSLCRKAWICLWLSLDLRRFQMMQFRLSCGLNAYWTTWLWLILPHIYVPIWKHLKTPSMVWVCMFTGAFRSIKDQQRGKYSNPLHHHHHSLGGVGGDESMHPFTTKQYFDCLSLWHLTQINMFNLATKALWSCPFNI